MADNSQKNIYRKCREDLGLTRERASELLEGLPPERIERIESGKFSAHPDEVMLMAEKYNAPELCNHYCAHECEIGKHYVPEVQMKNLPEIVLEMLAALNSIKKEQERLIEITSDGKVDSDEKEDFLKIQRELEKISVNVEELQLWNEKTNR